VSVRHVRAEFRTATQENAGALIVLENILSFRYRAETMYGLREYAEAGGLIAYGPNLAQMYRRSATYVDKILKGPKPADLPVEQPVRFELLLNLKSRRGGRIALVLTRAPNVG
jgi:putative tryptophan/tyrosine transport system substrate-binding protein